MITHLEPDILECEVKWALGNIITNKASGGDGNFPKKGNTKKCSNYHTIALTSHAGKIMLKILQVKFQQYVNSELPDVQAVFRKGRGTSDQIANIRCIKKAGEFQRNIYFYIIDYAKAFEFVDHNKLWKILKEIGIQDHLICLLRKLYAG